MTALSEPGWSEEEIEELREDGRSPEEIEEIITAKQPDPFGLWPENFVVVQAFLECHWDRQLGAMGGAAWMGIPAPEIDSVMRNTGIQRQDRIRVFRGVKLMAAVARPMLNDMESERR